MKHTKFLILVGAAVVAATFLIVGSRWAKSPSGMPSLGKDAVNSASSNSSSNVKTAPFDLAADPRPFASLNIKEQKVFTDAIGQLKTEELFRIWIECGTRHLDLVKQQTVGTILSITLREHPPSIELQNAFSRFLQDESVSSSDKAHLLGVFGRAATPESLDLLIQSARNFPDKELRRIAVRNIASVGDARGDGVYHVELSPALEGLWQKDDDEETLKASANSLGKVGALSGVKMLFSAAVDAKDKSARAVIAKDSLSATRNPAAIPFLASVLQDSSTIDPERALASQVLVAIGKPQSIDALIAWLKRADDSAVPLIFGYVTGSRSEEIISIWESAQNSPEPFHSGKIRDRIKESVSLFRAERK